jgi:hypothetical protein
MGGHQNAGDGGLDVRVSLPADVGLSGVGKTHLIQALFDERIGLI